MAEIKREKVILHEVTAQKILHIIKEQKLERGDRLPSERTLAQNLGISRTSLREALQSLEANGIVEIRRGSGIYVDIYDESMLTPSTEAGLNTYKDILTTVMHMHEARMMTELYCVRELAKKITPDQLERLKNHERNEYERLQCHNGAAAAPGLDFEQVLVSFIGNPVISNMHKRLNSMWKSYLADINAVVLSPAKRHKDHLAVLKALEERDSQKAEKALRQHLVQSGESIQQLLNKYKEISDELPEKMTDSVDISVD